MKNSYEITEYTPAWKESALELLAHLWGNNQHQNRELFAWKHENNPYSDRPRLFVAVDGDRVIGLRGLFGSLWHGFSGNKRCFCLADTIVDPEFRNRGILRAITTFIFSRYDQRQRERLLTLSPSRATRHVALSMGGHEVASFGATQRRETRSLKTMNANDPPPRSSDAKIQVETRPRPQAMARLVDRLPQDDRIRHVRDLEYFRWRFLNPRSRYVFFYLGADTLDGYLVLQLANRDDQTVGRILDWEATSDIGLSELLNAAISQRLSRRLKIWTANIDSHRAGLLMESDFDLDARATSDSPGLLVNGPEMPSADPSCDRWLDGRNWDLRMLYADSF